MNLLEAIQGAGENWFRPAEMASTSYAFMFDEYGFLRLVTHDNAGNLILSGRGQALIELKSDFTGEWEIVTPEQVLSERKL